ncbi:MAG: TetR family transcriptional regulator [Proteobacteria bacterium]|nr:TetR family transcriptional regulator [Pseudomonadota bacterium]
MKPLPDILQTREEPLRLPKRERTRRQLVAAAIAAFSRHGVADTTLQQIAVVAGMTKGTVYNHFATKADIVQAVALAIAQTIRERSKPARAALASGAEQMAAGCRRYLDLAQGSPAWALLVLDVASVDPTFRKTIASFVQIELRRGLRQKEFSVASEAAALDLIIGTTMEGMRRIALGRTHRQHAAAVTVSILRGLGVAPARARRISMKRLPLFAA